MAELYVWWGRGHADIGRRWQVGGDIITSTQAAAATARRRVCKGSPADDGGQRHPGQVVDRALVDAGVDDFMDTIAAIIANL